MKAPLKRVHVVWLAFVGAMTGVGGLLLALEDRPVPRDGGISLAPLAAANSVTGAERDILTRAPLDRQRWQSIVIHHSGSLVGSPATIAREHEARNFAGLGHHFVIGNGSLSGDGELNIGFRWLDQLPGAHAGGPDGHWHNQHSISICLVGDGNRRPFTEAQLQRLFELTRALCRELNIPQNRVFLYSDVAPVNSPGQLFPRTLLNEHLATAR